MTREDFTHLKAMSFESVCKLLNSNPYFVVKEMIKCEICPLENCNNGKGCIGFCYDNIMDLMDGVPTEDIIKK